MTAILASLLMLLALADLTEMCDDKLDGFPAVSVSEVAARVYSSKASDVGTSARPTEPSREKPAAPAGCDDDCFCCARKLPSIYTVAGLAVPKAPVEPATTSAHLTSAPAEMFHPPRPV